MHSAYLLVTDRSPESAEHINSLLRNSGIKIHVIHAQTSAEVKRAMDQDLPVLVLYADADESDASLEEICELADAFNVPVALFSDLEDTEKLAGWLCDTSCYVINSKREDLLTSAVERLIGNSERERNSRSQQEHLEELEHRYDLLLDSSRDAIAYIHEGLHVYANRAYLEALRVTDESEIGGLSLLDLIDAGNVNLKKLLQGFSRGSFPAKALDVAVKRPDGTQFEASLRFSPARFDGEDCTQMMVQHKDAANELAAELERMRYIDPLTQLYNRKAFIGELETRMTAPGADNATAVLYIEPDAFEDLQEDLDVEAADTFITDLAHLLQHSMSDGDIAAHLSDRGLAVLAQRSTTAELEALAEEILAAFRGHIVELDERSLTVSCSIGLSIIGRLVVNPREVIAGARKAQAEAAATGDCYVSYRPQLTAVTSAEGEPQWIERLRYALGNHDFYTVQQSIIDLDGEGEQLIENITYMRGEDGDHAPHEFQAIADRNDLAGTIDREVIPGMLKNLGDSEGRQVINLSENSILDYGFPGWFADQIKAACIEGDKVIVQVEAQAALGNLRPVQRLIKELEPLGCRFSLSRFDAERRTCQVLDHLDVHFIKLNAALTEDLTANSKQQEAVHKIVEAAEAHDIAVIADEVTDTSSLAVLWQSGVKLIAGSFLRETTQVLAQ